MKNFSIFCFFLILLLFSQKIIFAQCQKIDSPASKIIQGISEWLKYLVGAWVVLLFVFAAYKFIKSEGDPKEIMEIKQMLVAGFLGVAIAWAATTIINTITGCQ
jgi:Na+-driven multidrug efflux pump